MKYIRKAIMLMLAVMFLAAVIIGMSVIFAVRNINIYSYSYIIGEESTCSQEFSEAVQNVKDELSVYEGKLIIGVDQADIQSTISDSGYAQLYSCEKVYPCTLNVTVKEKLEIFAVPSEDGLAYDIYDDQFSYIITKSSNVNNLDGSPNILLSNVTTEDFSYVSQAVTVLSENYSSVRAFAESISINIVSAENRDTLCIKLRCGLTFEIVDYSQNVRSKTLALIEAFSQLQDYQKLGGKMTCQATSSGELKVVLPDGSII